uniref:Small membrane A-kinase anchor protein n=1 Tax=Pygocentrus nattereri TaxID=42514 RepID=A0A3B4CR66_PYGNA
MGCVKSKHSDPTQNSGSSERVDGRPGKKRGEKAVLVYAETDPAEDSPCVNPVLLDYAQRLSEEIVARAVQQWAEVDSRYSDIPYIEWPSTTKYTIRSFSI